MRRGITSAADRGGEKSAPMMHDRPLASSRKVRQSGSRVVVVHLTVTPAYRPRKGRWIGGSSWRRPTLQIFSRQQRRLAKSCRALRARCQKEWSSGQLRARLVLQGCLRRCPRDGGPEIFITTQPNLRWEDEATRQSRRKRCSVPQIAVWRVSKQQEDAPRLGHARTGRPERSSVEDPSRRKSPNRRGKGEGTASVVEPRPT